jgi:uncharacterized Rmd1/YagE family protein
MTCETGLVSTPLFPGASAVRARALYLGERIDVRALEATQRLSPLSPLVLAAGERGVAVFFRYGVVVFFNVAPLEDAGFVTQLRSFVGEPFAKPETEDLEIRIADDAPADRADRADRTDSAIVTTSQALTVAALTVERVQVIAEILARSVALSRYEAAVRESYAAMEGWAQGLQRGHKRNAFEAQLRKNLGSTILIQSAMTGRIEIDDKPELLWERPDLERLYLRLEDEFELRERDKVLERRLGLISSTAEMLLNLSDNKHAHRLEWYIIVLILGEMAITLITLALGIAH